MRILYAATGEIALPLFGALCDLNLVCGVLTSVDKRGKRGSTLVPSPIKTEALKRDVPILQFESLKREARDEVRKLSPDTLLSFSYGKIFGPMFLDMFKWKLNVHPSLLPKYRGMSPIYETIKNGDERGGITLQDISLNVDEGDIYSRLSFDLDGSETTDTLTKKVSVLASKFVVNSLLEFDSLVPYRQEGEISYTKEIKKEDGKLDFNESGKSLHQMIRALYPWPKAYSYIGDDKLILSSVYGSSFEDFESTKGEEPGTVVLFDPDRGFKVATKDTYIYINRVQAEYKKEMDAKSYFNGNKSIIGNVFNRGNLN